MGFPLYVERDAVFGALKAMGIDVDPASINKIEINDERMTFTVWPRLPSGGTAALRRGPLRIDVAIVKTDVGGKEVLVDVHEPAPAADSYKAGAQDALGAVQRRLNVDAGTVITWVRVDQILDEVRAAFEIGKD